MSQPTAGTDSPQLFDRFLGEWRIENAQFDEHSSLWTRSRRTWRFVSILDGLGVQDWLSDDDGRMLGTTVRTWDEQVGWRAVWFCPRGSEHVSLRAADLGTSIRLDGRQADGRRVRWILSALAAESFAWDGWCSNDDGASWWHEQHMDAVRAPAGASAGL